MGYDDLVKRLLFFGVVGAIVAPGGFPVVGGFPGFGALFGPFFLGVGCAASGSVGGFGCLFLSSIVTTSLDHHNPVS